MPLLSNNKTIAGEETLAWLHAWFKKRSLISDDAMDPDINFIENGFLDSLGLIELIGDLEQTFAVRFSDAHFQDARFLTLRGIAALIEEIKSSRS